MMGSMTVNSRPLGRPPLPDGHRRVVSIKLSDAEAALIESARGATPRAAWMREAILLAARRNPGIPEPPAAAPRRNPGIPQPGRKSKPRASAAPPAEFREPAPAARDPKACKHEGMRMTKGVCGSCGAYAVKGKAGPA